ncbi:MAG TPA: hypothetical protein VFU50_20405 [Terriglobales bacterium]|nr:hypothetical protein [Terriglobales bacterium]
MAALTLNSNLPFELRDYADQLDEIRNSLSAMAKKSGEYKEIVSRMATNVHSASNILRAASHVINSMESHKEHEANKAERAEAKARRAGRGRWRKIRNE